MFPILLHVHCMFATHSLHSVIFNQGLVTWILLLHSLWTPALLTKTPISYARFEQLPSLPRHSFLCFDSNVCSFSNACSLYPLLRTIALFVKTHIALSWDTHYINTCPSLVSILILIETPSLCYNSLRLTTINKLSIDWCDYHNKFTPPNIIDFASN